MNNEQFHLMIELISTFDQSTGKFLAGVDRNGRLIYVNKENPPFDKSRPSKDPKRTHYYLTKDHTTIKAAFRYEE